MNSMYCMVSLLGKFLIIISFPLNEVAVAQSINEGNLEFTEREEKNPFDTATPDLRIPDSLRVSGIEGQTIVSLKFDKNGGIEEITIWRLNLIQENDRCFIDYWHTNYEGKTSKNKHSPIIRPYVEFLEKEIKIYLSNFDKEDMENFYGLRLPFKLY